MKTNCDENEALAKKYVDQVLLNQNLAIVDEFFNDNGYYTAEFGDTWCKEGIKTNVEYWRKLFKPQKIDIVDKYISDSSVVFHLMETCIHTGCFKSINPSGKEVESIVTVKFHITHQDITTYAIQRNVYDIVLQLVNYNESAANKMTQQSILTQPYEVALESIRKRFQTNNINITLEQTKCLCALSMFDEPEYIAPLVDLDAQTVTRQINALLVAFHCESTAQLTKIIEQPFLVYYVAEAFELMVLASQYFLKTENAHRLIPWPDYIRH